MYKFHDVTLAFYDFHATEQPLASSRPGDYYQPEFRFLVDQQAYRQAFDLRQRVASRQFNFYPLPGRDRRTHFWESYLDLTVNPAADWWLYQAPWVCRNLHVDLRLNGGPAGVTAELRKEIYLSALGWSTQVIVRLVGDLNTQQLSAAVGRLARGSSTGPQAPFLVDGRPQDLTGVFQHLAGLIQEQVFVPGKNPHRSKYFPRKRLIAVAEFDAPPKNQRLFGGYDNLFQAEKADLQSVLFGRSVQVSQLKGDGELLRTVISGANYALTEWNEGTLLFPLRDGFIKAGKCGKMHCLANNLRACQTMAFLLLEYIKAGRTAPPGSAAQALRSQAQAALITIADRYCNTFCQHIFQKHPELSREVPPSPYRCG